MKSATGVCSVIIKWGVVALIAFTPFAFGTVEEWSVALMEWGIISIAGVHVLGRLWSLRPEDHPPIRFTGLEVPLGLFFVLILLQTVPLPSRWLEAISPGSARMYGVATPVPPAEPGEIGNPEIFAQVAPATVRRPISVLPGESRSRLLLLASLTALFLFVSDWARGKGRALFLVGAIVTVGFGVAVEGLIQFLTWNGRIYWVRKVPPSSPFGPFVNHNHFAGYVEMVIPVAIALAFYLLDARFAPRDGEGGRTGKGALALFSVLILVVALFFSLSRGGIASAVGSALFLFVLLWPRIPSRPLKWTIAVALPVMIVMMIGWIGADLVRTRIGTYGSIGNEASFRYRVRIWESMVHHLPDFIWAGSGLGTFEESFAPFVPSGSAKRWDKAHNDYLQLLWESGIAGGVLLLAAAVVFIRRFWWPAVRSRGEPEDLFRVGIAVALMSIAIHSLVDFNLQIGANGFLFALLAALLVSLHRDAERSRLRGPEPVVKAFSR